MPAAAAAANSKMFYSDIHLDIEKFKKYNKVLRSTGSYEVVKNLLTNYRMYHLAESAKEEKDK